MRSESRVRNDLSAQLSRLHLALVSLVVALPAAHRPGPGPVPGAGRLADQVAVLAAVLVDRDRRLAAFGPVIPGRLDFDDRVTADHPADVIGMAERDRRGAQFHIRTSRIGLLSHEP